MARCCAKYFKFLKLIKGNTAMNAVTSPTPSCSPASPAGFMPHLLALEEQLQAMSDALIAGHALEFEGLCTSLAPLMADFSRAYATVPPKVTASRSLKNRLRVLGNNLTLQRENMARRAVSVERELQVMLPANPVPTYGKQGGVYGVSGRTMGRLTSMRA